MNPIIPVAIDLSMKRAVTIDAATIKGIAPQRSSRGARLKNAHQTTIAKAATSPPNIP